MLFLGKSFHIARKYLDNRKIKEVASKRGFQQPSGLSYTMRHPYVGFIQGI